MQNSPFIPSPGAFPASGLFLVLGQVQNEQDARPRLSLLAEPPGREDKMKDLVPVVGCVVVGGLLYVLQAPPFLILLGAAGTALITAAKLWGRKV